MTLLRNLIILNEGMRLKPYRCTAGKLTIGVGHNLDDNGITTDQAIYILEHDITEARAQASTYPWFTKLDEVRQAAVIDLMFNLGHKRFAAFTKFIQAMSRRDWAWAAAELVDSRWYGQVGDRGKRIVRMISKGEWPAEVKQ